MAGCPIKNLAEHVSHKAGHSRDHVDQVDEREGAPSIRKTRELRGRARTIRLMGLASTMQAPVPSTRSRQGSSSQYQAWSCTVGVCNGVAGVRPAPAAKAATHAPIGMLRSHAPPTHEMKMPVSTDPLPSTASSGRVLQWGRAQQVSGRLGGYRFVHAAPCPASNAHWPEGDLRRAMHRGHHLKVAPLGDSVSTRVSVHHHLWGRRTGGGGGDEPERASQVRTQLQAWACSLHTSTQRTLQSAE